MASKQTAVEWLKEQLFDPYIMDQLMTNQYYREPLEFKIKDLFDQAKELEKQQIIDAYDEGYGIRDAYGDCSDNQTPEQFYASTYNL